MLKFNLEMDSNLSFLKLLVGRYFVGNEGGSCEDGLMIMNKQACKEACNTLGLLTGAMKNNKACYLAGNGKCRQDGRYKPGTGTKISPICISNHITKKTTKKGVPTTTTEPGMYHFFER